MATYQVSPPETFSFTRPEEWPRWIRHFERFRCASGLDAKTEAAQVNTLIYSMGDEADDILRSLGLSAEDSKKYGPVKAKFEAHFVKRRNTIFERANFNMRKQEDGEPVDAFVTELYALAEHCGYGALHDELIRDRLVVGLRDVKLSERLQLNADLTLDTAVTQARQSETVKRQQSALRAGLLKPDTTIGSVQRRNPPNAQGKQRPKQGGGTQWSSTRACYRCGKSPSHHWKECPAMEATCRKCGKRGHFQKVCRFAAKVREVCHDHTSSDEGEAFLGAVGSDTESRDPWSVTLLVNGQAEEFLIDTGAEVTVVPQATFDHVGGGSLLRPRRTLRGPSRHILPVKGQFTAKLSKDSQVIEQELFVVKGLHKPLLGRPAIEALGLVQRMLRRMDLEQFSCRYSLVG